MPCYKPIKAYKTTDGVVFAQLARYDIIGDIKLPCGQCIGCRIDRAREWSVRCMHEAKMHAHNSFITLSYNDDNLPERGSLDYRHFQLFMKRLRKKIGAPVRFFMCGEYGEENKRPHYHAILFGYNFPDRYYWGTSPAGNKVYRSATLENTWVAGNSLIGDVTRQSAGYVARYCIKKQGDISPDFYKDKEPEFLHMSLKPGIGAEFFHKYRSDILPNDYIIDDGVKIPVPKYYDKLYKGDIDEIKWEREKYAKKYTGNNTPERLAAREEVQKAKIKSLLRNKV